MAQTDMAAVSEPLSDDEMRRTWALVDLLTSFKRRANHPPPTAELIGRKFAALTKPASDTLSMLMDCSIQQANRGLSQGQVYGMVEALKIFPKETATEVAHVHACNSVISPTARQTVSREASHILRIGLEHLAVAQQLGMPLCPIPTDHCLRALHAVKNKSDTDRESTALKILGVAVGDATVRKGGCFSTANGLLTGTAFCIAVMDYRPNLPIQICCGSCYRIVHHSELSICRQCGDHLACESCSGHARHMSECRRVRSVVRCMAQSLMPHMRESARRVAVVQLSSSGLMAPMATTCVASPLFPSSLLESLSRCPALVPRDLLVYWRLLVSFLANGDDCNAINHEAVYHVQAAECAKAETQPTSRGPPRLLPSERRRLQKEAKAAEKRAKAEAAAAAEAAAVAEADAVLERQSSRADATSAMLTSVLLKRGGTASPEVVARTRAKRDLLKAAEMRARKSAKAKPGKPNASKRTHINEDQTNARLAAALLLQRRARTWLRSRKKLRRKQRSCAARRIQSSVRTWLLLRVMVKPYITKLPEPDSPRLALNEPATTECTICLDADAEYAVVPCGHRCLCASCIKAVSECPVCRQAMTAVLRIFI